MKVHRVSLSIPAERYVALYAGKVTSVRAVTEEGLRVQFPGKVLNRFVTHEGLYGRFELKIDNNNRLQSIGLIN